MSIDKFDEESNLDQIANTVLHRGVPGLDKKSKDTKSIILTYGAKSLSVWVDSVEKLISTKIESVPEKKQKPYETRILYWAAKQFMQQAVNELRTKYRYKLVTKNTNMKDWARGPGAEIFHWTDTGETSNGADKYRAFETSFVPENYEPDQKTI